MIRFRKAQKEFALPIALLRGLASAKKIGGAVLNYGGSASMIASTVQGAKGNQLMKQQNAEMERSNREQQRMEKQRLDQEKKWQEEQLKIQNKALKKGISPFGDVLNSGGQPSTPIQMPEPNIVSMTPAIFQQKAASETLSTSGQKDFSTFSFAKDMALLASRNRGLMINGILAGAATTAGVYSVDKAIRDDKKRKGEKFIDEYNEEDPSDGNSRNKFNEKSFSRRRVSLKAPVFSFALGAATPAISYAAEKKLEKDMLNDTTVTSEDSRSPKFKEKSFAVKPNKILNSISIVAGGGGAKGMRNLGIQISAIGKKSGNKATQKLGKAILDNPNASMALSIPTGAAILSGTFTLGDKIATKIAKEVDPDAFKYVESKEKEIE